MRFFTFLSGLIFSSGLLSAQEVINVTPQTLAGWTLAGWTVVGAEAATLAGQSELTLPAGAQLARAFDGRNISLHLETRAVVGADESDWPVIELGSIALIFGRNSQAGTLLLAVSGAAPQPLPYEFDLDATGLSKELLSLTLARKGSTLSVEIPGRVLQFEVGPDANRDFEIVVSAGAAHVSTFDNLTITTKSVDWPTLVKESPVSTSIALDFKANPTGLTAAPEVSLTRFNPPVISSAVVSAQSKSGVETSAVRTPKFALEIFTPPAVRRGRADALRVQVPILKRQ